MKIFFSLSGQPSPRFPSCVRDIEIKSFEEVRYLWSQNASHVPRSIFPILGLERKKKPRVKKERERIKQLYRQVNLSSFREALYLFSFLSSLSLEHYKTDGILTCVGECGTDVTIAGQ